MLLKLNIGSTAAQVLTCFTVCMATFVAGTVMGFTSPALPQLQAKSTSDHSTLSNVSDADAAWIVSLCPLGALCGSLLASPMLSTIGRRRCHLWVTAPTFVASWVLVSGAVHIAMMYVGRFLGGLGMGIALTAAPIMIIETADVSLRGYLGSLPQTFATAGTLYSSVLGIWLGWSPLGWVCLVPVVPYVICLLLVPDSPVWLLSNRGRQEALEALTWLRGGDVQLAEERLSAMEKEKESTKDEKTPTYKDSFALLKKAPYLKAFLIVVGLMMLQQLSGITSLLFYTVPIFQVAGSSLEPYVAGAIVGVVATLAPLIGTLLVERAGRRLLLTLSASVMTVALAGLGTYFYLKDHGSAPPGWLPLLFMAVEIISFASGWGPLVWLVGAELLPYEIMSIANPIAVSLNSGCVFLITFTFKSLQKAIRSYGLFWLYGSIALVCVPFSLFIAPETKGLTSEEIRAIFFGPELKNIQSDKSTVKETV